MENMRLEDMVAELQQARGHDEVRSDVATSPAPLSPSSAHMLSTEFQLELAQTKREAMEAREAQSLAEKKLRSLQAEYDMIADMGEQDALRTKVDQLTSDLEAERASNVEKDRLRKEKLEEELAALSGKFDTMKQR